MKILSFCAMLVFMIILCSCEEDFNQFGDLQNEYVLNCVLNSDTTYQEVTVSHSYLVYNLDPYTYTDDPAVKGATVRISFGDSVKVFTQSLVEREDYSRYPDPAIIYSNDDFTPEPNTEYIIDAHLPNGVRLRATTQTPASIHFDPWKCDTLIPPAAKDWVGVYWDPPAEDHYVAAVYKVYYFKKENEQKVRYEKKIPVKYLLQGETLLPYFPEPSYSPMIFAEVDAFARALEEISEGDPNKDNYIILAFILEARIYDRNLTSYYAAQREVGESFTLKVDESDYTNIEGGLGIFGSYIKQRKAIKFSHAFIEQFGYIPGLTE